jgi:hypothetical protein
MIPPMRGILNLQVSFGSVQDVTMTPADTVVRKHAADDEEVQGEQLDLTLGLNYRGEMMVDKDQEGRQGDPLVQPSKHLMMDDGKDRRFVRTGHVKKARPNVWSRQAP